uniref:(northern house mosquito) hypothetical protein n=1 Tax=Culex pipiens TaxID=7175 RepID=A0A8D8CFN4_CULPI
MSARRGKSITTTARRRFPSGRSHGSGSRKRAGLLPRISTASIVTRRENGTGTGSIANGTIGIRPLPVVGQRPTAASIPAVKAVVAVAIREFDGQPTSHTGDDMKIIITMAQTWTSAPGTRRQRPKPTIRTRVRQPISRVTTTAELPTTTAPAKD